MMLLGYNNGGCAKVPDCLANEMYETINEEYRNMVSQFAGFFP